MIHFAVFLLLYLVSSLPGYAAESDRWDAIRAFAGQATTLETTMGSDMPKYQVVRLNATPQEYAGDRYGMVKVKLPRNGTYTLVMLFSDVGNIVEYEIMPTSVGLGPLRGNTRLILPALTDEHDEQEVEGPDLALPKPWDHFELHLLGFDAGLLKPGEEYLIWFRFANKQPADVLFAATLLKGSADVGPERLRKIFALPLHKEE